MKLVNCPERVSQCSSPRVESSKLQNLTINLVYAQTLLIGDVVLSGLTGILKRSIKCWFNRVDLRLISENHQTNCSNTSFKCNTQLLQYLACICIYACRPHHQLGCRDKEHLAVDKEMKKSWSIVKQDNFNSKYRSIMAAFIVTQSHVLRITEAIANQPLRPLLCIHLDMIFSLT